MNDQELLISTGKCWACNAGLTSLSGQDRWVDGFTPCECKRNFDSVDASKKYNFNDVKKTPGTFFARCEWCNKRMRHRFFQCAKCNQYKLPDLNLTHLL